MSLAYVWHYYVKLCRLLLCSCLQFLHLVTKTCACAISSDVMFFFYKQYVISPPSHLRYKQRQSTHHLNDTHKQPTSMARAAVCWS